MRRRRINEGHSSEQEQVSDETRELKSPTAGALGSEGQRLLSGQEERGHMRRCWERGADMLSRGSM